MPGGYHNPLNTAGNAIRKATPKPKPQASGGGGLIMTGDYRSPARKNNRRTTRRGSR